jgi:putative membrane protein
MDLLLGTLVLRPYVFAFLAGFLAAAQRDLGWRRTVRFTACVWPLAWLAEFSSTRIGVPFGLYHYTESTRGQELYVANVPFMDSLSFTFLAYAAFCLARVATRRRQVPPAAVAVLAGALMMLLDVVIDPLAVRGDRWFLGRIFYYPEGGVYFGVPLSNFLGWWIVGAAGVGLYLAGAAGGPGRGPHGPGRGPHGPGRGPHFGVGLYYAVVLFNFAVTVWIGEWVLAAVGVALHGALAAGLRCLNQTPEPHAGLGTEGVQRA